MFYSQNTIESRRKKIHLLFNLLNFIILNLMSQIQQVGTGARKDWKGYVMLQKHLFGIFHR